MQEAALQHVAISTLPNVLQILGLFNLYPRKSQHHVEKYFFPSSAHVLLIYGAVCALIAGPGKKWDGSTAGPFQKDSLAFR